MLFKGNFESGHEHDSGLTRCQPNKVIVVILSTTLSEQAIERPKHMCTEEVSFRYQG